MHTAHVLWTLRTRRERLFELASLDVAHGFEESCYARRVSRELSQVLIAVHDAAECIGRGEQETSVRHET